jgi:serine/threonine protein kinase/tetratricopeptide (TPR) repeat protein
MSANQASANACKHCEKPLPENHSGRICPACLMAEALQVSEVLEGGSLEETNPESYRESAIPDSLEGTKIGLDGRYKLLQKIGEGGFGTVYMAEQSKPVRRRVAVKILKAGMDTRQFVARFEAERQALAMMDHPNIARIIDGGESEQGRPFLVMELVRGIPITTFCDEQNFGTEQRLNLFTKVCRAVQHAHQKGIIHRDLKPGNILVTVEDGAEPVPKVIDFGVAKAADTPLTDKTLFTRFEQMIGTPAYMSPEQAGTHASHDVDTRADIYALGVLLYELLTGTTPIEEATLKGAAFDEVRRILREDEAPRPSARLSSLELERRTTIAKSRDTQSVTLGRQLRGDLDWIVMKAIEKDRRRRYDTANALAADVERHLEDEPVSAGPPTAAYRTGKFLRRHKSTVAVAAAMLLLLVVGIAASSWQAIRATAEKRRANEEKQHAIEAEALAEDRLVEAEAISGFLTGMFESAKPGTEDGGRAVTVVESLKIAEKKLEEDAEMPAERRAVLQKSIAGVYRSLGLYPDAVALGEQVLEYCSAKHGEQHPDTLKAKKNLATYYDDVDRWDEAQAMREEVLAESRKILGPEHPVTLAAMTGLANSYGNADRPYNNPDRWDDALAMREEVLTIHRRMLGTEHPNTLGAMNNLALSYANGGRQDQALAIQEEVLTIRRKVRGPEHPNTLNAMKNLACSYAHAGRHDEALAMREQELKRRRVLGPEHPIILETMYDLSRSYAHAGRRDEELKIREEMVALSRKILGPEHYQTLDGMGHVASTYAALGRRDEALKLREEVLALDREILGLEHNSTLRAMNNLAESYRDTDRLDDATTLGEEVLALSLKALGSQDYHTRLSKGNLADYYLAAGRLDEAAKLRGPGHVPVKPDSPRTTAVLVPRTSVWLWLHPLDGVDPAEANPNFHRSFFLADYDDSAWQSGKDSEATIGGFGYDDEDFSGVDIGTPVTKALGKSAYFRHRFTTEEEFTKLELRCRRDDGIIVFLDGKEVARGNMNEGKETYRLPADWTVGGTDETTVYRLPLEDLTLPPGEHVLAISLHNHAEPVSDLRIGGITLVEVE